PLWPVFPGEAVASRRRGGGMALARIARRQRWRSIGPSVSDSLRRLPIPACTGKQLEQQAVQPCAERLSLSGPRRRSVRGSERVRERLALPPAGGPGLVGRSALWGGLGKRSCVLPSRAFGHIDSPFAIRGDVAGGPPPITPAAWRGPRRPASPPVGPGGFTRVRANRATEPAKQSPDKAAPPLVGAP